MKTDLLEHALKLPLPERIKLADEIYRSVDRETDDSVSPELLAEMEWRDAEYENNPNSGCTVEELEKKFFKRELDRRLELMRENPSRAVPWNQAKKIILKRRSHTN